MDQISQTINSSNYVFYFLVVDDFLDIDLYPQLQNFHLIYAYDNKNIAKLKQKNAPYFCLAEKGSQLEEKNTGRLLEHPQVIEYITSTSTGKIPAIVPFKPSAKIDLICQKNNWTVIANPSQLNRFLEDKIKFYQNCRKFNLPLIPSDICPLTEANFAECQTKFGQTLVLQTHFGWAGKSTYVFNNWQEALAKLTPGITVKISPLLSGYSLLNNCCFTKQGLIQSPPALQFTGLPQFTTNPFTTVGRQWPSQAPTSVINKINQITQDFYQKILTPLTYKGFFGLDFFVDNQENVYLLECNPRLTASFAFYTQLELNQNLTPLFFFHLLEFTNLNYQTDITQEQHRFYNSAIVGSELTPKDSDSNTIIKYNDFSIFSDSVNPVIIKPSVIDSINAQIHGC